MISGNGRASNAPDRLQPASRDSITLALALESRFVELCGTYFRIKGSPLTIPDNLKQDALRWREFMARVAKGDRRIKRSELLGIRSMCQWTLNLNQQLRNQPTTLLQWKD